MMNILSRPNLSITQHHLIVAHEVTTTGHDRTQLANMGKQAKDALQKEALTVVADKGYYKVEEVVACETEGITPCQSV